jgi:hypothetical protein
MKKWICAIETNFFAPLFLKVEKVEKVENFIIECPHCKDSVLIEQLNCRIFRHGILKHNGVQINPHSPKDLCDHYVKNNMIYGCGKPFLIKGDAPNLIVEICDYI